MRSKQRNHIGLQYNIPVEIIRSAEARGLDAIATGGGCDYICRNVGDEENAPIMVLVAADDAGSPLLLGEKSNVTLYINSQDWSDGGYISFNFDTTVDALDFMAGFETTVLDLPHMKDNPLSCRSCGKELGTNPMCRECCFYGSDKHQLSMVEVAKSVFGMSDDKLLNNPEQDKRASESGRIAQGWNSVEGGSDARE